MKHLLLFLFFTCILPMTHMNAMEAQVPCLPVEITGHLIMALASTVPMLPTTMATLKNLKFVCRSFHSYIDGFEKNYQCVSPLIQKLAAKHTIIYSSCLAQSLNCQAAKMYIEHGNKLIQACFEKNLKSAQELLQEGADANFMSKMGNSPLNTILFFHEICRYKEDIQFAFRRTDDWRPSRAYSCIPYSDDEKGIIKLLLGGQAKLTLNSPEHMFESIDDMKKHLKIHVSGYSVIPKNLFSTIIPICKISSIKEKVKIILKSYSELEELLSCDQINFEKN